MSAYTYDIQSVKWCESSSQRNYEYKIIHARNANLKTVAGI